MSKKSKMYAEKHREKIAPGLELDIVNFLHTKHEVKTKIKQEKFNAIYSAKIEEEERETTFKPKTNNFEHQLD